MKKYHILGHSNAALGIILDTIHAIHGDYGAEAEIISNIPDDEITYRHLPFKIKTIAVAEIFYEAWKPSRQNLLLAGMTSQTKKVIAAFFHEHYGIDIDDYESLVHPNASIAATAEIGAGSVVNPGVVLAPYAQIERLVMVNRLASIGHHTTVSDYATLNPGCHVAGRCEVGEGATIGMGSCVIDGITIGSNAFVGAGSLVTKDVPPDTMVYGSPAKKIRRVTE
jgi:sugar O-acyltransferase (sialic acid O-acetyltransferase NeuD family)